MSKIIKYNELLSSNSNVDDKQKKEKEIKDAANKICTRRRNYAESIRQQVENIEFEAGIFYQAIKNIEKFCSTLDNNDEIRKKCTLLEKSIKNYVSECRNLCERFRNQKIKVVAFGPKSQGKSTFTQLYTGLDNEVVAIKPNGNDDKTGATSVIIHDEKTQSPTIKVLLKSQEEILSEININLKALRSYDLQLHGTTDGKYNSWDDFMEVMNNPDHKKDIFKKLLTLTNNRGIINFTEICNDLQRIFRTEIEDQNIYGYSDFSDVQPQSQNHNEGITIQLNELPMYNDMQYKGKQKFMTVSLIKIFTNLGKNGMFENFEIFDTKGLGVEAGGSPYEDTVYQILNNADAAFSIFRLQTADTSSTFYDSLARKIHSMESDIIKPLNFKYKHFVILNIGGDGFTQQTPTVANNIINEEDIANKIYIGTLKTGKYDDIEMDANLFVDSLILDMLKSIVDYTENYDKSLITNCNTLIESINRNKKDLINCLSKLPNEEEFDFDSILSKKIDSFRKSALEELKKISEKEKISLSDVSKSSNLNNKSVNQDSTNPKEDDDDEYDDDEYDNKYDEESSNYKENEISEKKCPMPPEFISDDRSQPDPNIRIFKMITGHTELEEKTIKEIIKDCRSIVDVSDTAINYIIDKELKDLAGSNVFMGPNKKDAIPVDGSASQLGCYIDSISSLLYDIIFENINVKYSKSQNIENIIKLKENVHTTIWNIFHFNKLYEPFKESLLLNKHNKIINLWLEIYNKPKTDSEGRSIIPEKSYNILISYFKKVDYKTTSELDTQPILDWKKLKEAICEVYRRFNFEQRIKDKLANEEMLKRDILIDLRGLLLSDSFISGIKEMYKVSQEALEKASIFNEEDIQKIKNQNERKKLEATRLEIKDSTITSLGIQ